MSNKNPFEIRTDVLGMAKEYLDKQYEVNLAFAMRAVDIATETGKATAAEIEKYVPKMYSTEELMSKAQELYSFIQKKD